MPFATVISKKIFCIYSGIGQKLIRLPIIASIIRQIDNPFLHTYCKDFLTTCPSCKLSAEAGKFPNFTQESFTTFLKANNFQFFIRGHENIPEGYANFFEGKGISLFSSSTFNEEQNKCGFLFIGKDGVIVVNVLPRSNMLLRTNSHFKNISQ